jgi:hypothetical protein
MTHVDGEALRAQGLAVTGAANHYRHPELFRVVVRLADDYQIFVDTPRRNRSPAELAEKVCETLAGGPGRWRASWRPTKPAPGGPHTIARRSRRREHFP